MATPPKAWPPSPDQKKAKSNDSQIHKENLEETNRSNVYVVKPPANPDAAANPRRAQLLDYLEGVLALIEENDPPIGDPVLRPMLHEAIDGLRKLGGGEIPPIFRKAKVKASFTRPVTIQEFQLQALGFVELLHSLGEPYEAARHTVAEDYGEGVAEAVRKQKDQAPQKKKRKQGLAAEKSDKEDSADTTATGVSAESLKQWKRMLAKEQPSEALYYRFAARADFNRILMGLYASPAKQPRTGETHQEYMERMIEDAKVLLRHAMRRAGEALRKAKKTKRSGKDEPGRK